MSRVAVVTIWQPWAWAIVAGHKRIENRGWKTTHRGRLLIHAGKSYDHSGEQWLLEEGVSLNGDRHVLGAIVGEANLVDITNDPEEEDPFAVPGLFHWHLADAVAWAAPMPARGRQGLWWWSE